MTLQEFLENKSIHFWGYPVSVEGRVLQKYPFLLENPPFSRSQGNFQKNTSQRQLLDLIQKIFFGDEADDGEVFFLTEIKFKFTKIYETEESVSPMICFQIDDPPVSKKC